MKYCKTSIRLRRGFTLVELMIALLLTGVMSVLIYQLFDSTSENFLEVDQLADTTDRLRFASERLRNDLHMAGSFMTPDSELDYLVQPKVTDLHVAGFMTYDGWQDDRTVMLGEVAAANPNVSFDGIVVLGAYDLPLSFEVASLVANDGDNSLAILAHHRGLIRLNVTDPFQTGKAAVSFNDVSDAAAQTALEAIFDGAQARLLRVSDRQGFQQFIQITDAFSASADFVAAGGGDDFNRVVLDIPGDETKLGPKFKRKDAGGTAYEYGFDGNIDATDVAYDAAFIDAFWYRVQQHPEDPRNLILVRERLCAPAVAEAFGAASFDPGADGLSASDCGAPEELIVIAQHVADFQIWFDCADGNAASNAGVVGNTWVSSWQAPNADTAPGGPGGCMDSANPQVGRARAAHIRLSLHTPTERKTQAHVQFEDKTGALAAPTDTTMLRTFDSYPTATGAAAVVTLQSDVELTNFSMRNAY